MNALPLSFVTQNSCQPLLGSMLTGMTTSVLASASAFACFLFAFAVTGASLFAFAIAGTSLFAFAFSSAGLLSFAFSSASLLTFAATRASLFAFLGAAAFSLSFGFSSFVTTGCK